MSATTESEVGGALDAAAPELTEESSQSQDNASNERSESPVASNSKSSATIEHSSASQRSSPSPQVSVSVESDIVTANAEILRSQLQESFNSIETSPSVFASPRPLVPYFFGRPDPHQRSYASQGDFTVRIFTHPFAVNCGH